jgi:CRISPR-associated protein Cmr5
VIVREHILAEGAFRAVQAAVDAGESEREQYLRAAEGFPSLVHTNGLAQATSFFIIAKDGRPRYLGDVATVLGIANAQQLHQRARTCDVEEYMHLTREVMMAAGWLKRYAQALLKQVGAAAVREGDRGE